MLYSAAGVVPAGARRGVSRAHRSRGSLVHIPSDSHTFVAARAHRSVARAHAAACAQGHRRHGRSCTARRRAPACTTASEPRAQPASARAQPRRLVRAFVAGPCTAASARAHAEPCHEVRPCTPASASASCTRARQARAHRAYPRCAHLASLVHRCVHQPPVHTGALPCTCCSVCTSGRRCARALTPSRSAPGCAWRWGRSPAGRATSTARPASLRRGSRPRAASRRRRPRRRPGPVRGAART